MFGRSSSSSTNNPPGNQTLDATRRSPYGQPLLCRERKNIEKLSLSLPSVVKEETQNGESLFPRNPLSRYLERARNEVKSHQVGKCPYEWHPDEGGS